MCVDLVRVSTMNSKEIIPNAGKAEWAIESCLGNNQNGKINSARIARTNRSRRRYFI